MSAYFLDRDACSHHTPFSGVDLFTAAGRNMTLSVVEMQPQAVIESHSHPHEQVGMLLEGEFEFTIGDETRLVKPGEMWRIPGGVPHKVVAGEAGARALDVFYPIREDYL